MQSIAYLAASNGSANASLMTVTNIRAALANTIKVNTVANVSAKFAGTMGTPHNFVDPVTGETITIISEASAVDFFGSISGSDVIIDQIAAGYTDLGSKVGDIIVIKPTTEGQNNLKNILLQSLNDNGSFKADSIVDATPFADLVDPVLRDLDLTPNIASVGTGIWSLVSALNGAMTALTVYIQGNRITIAAVASRAFTASKDTYVDVLRSGTTGTLVYTEVANGATAPTLAANSYRLAIITSNGSTLTTFNQDGGVDTSGEIVYRTRDSKNINLYNVDVMPNQPATTSGSAVIVNTGYPLPIKTSTGRLRVTMNVPLSISANNGQMIARINGTDYNVINTTGVSGTGMTGFIIVKNLPKNTLLTPTMYFMISGGATIALLQFRHMSWSVEEV